MVSAPNTALQTLLLLKTEEEHIHLRCQQFICISFLKTPGQHCGLLQLSSKAVKTKCNVGQSDMVGSRKY